MCFQCQYGGTCCGTARKVAARPLKCWHTAVQIAARPLKCWHTAVQKAARHTVVCVAAENCVRHTNFFNTYDKKAVKLILELNFGSKI